MKPSLAIVCAVLACAALGTEPVAAQPGAPAAAQQPQRRLIPLGQVIEQIRRRTPGRLLDAGIEYEGERPIYRVRWSTPDGRLIDYMIDAVTGAILSGG